MRRESSEAPKKPPQNYAIPAREKSQIKRLITGRTRHRSGGRAPPCFREESGCRSARDAEIQKEIPGPGNAETKPGAEREAAEQASRQAEEAARAAEEKREEGC